MNRIVNETVENGLSLYISKIKCHYSINDYQTSENDNAQYHDSKTTTLKLSVRSNVRQREKEKSIEKKMSCLSCTIWECVPYVSSDVFLLRRFFLFYLWRRKSNTDGSDISFLNQNKYKMKQSPRTNDIIIYCNWRILYNHMVIAPIVRTREEKKGIRQKIFYDILSMKAQLMREITCFILSFILINKYV